MELQRNKTACIVIYNAGDAPQKSKNSFNPPIVLSGMLLIILVYAVGNGLIHSRASLLKQHVLQYGKALIVSFHL